LLKQLDAGHLRHTLVSDDERDWITAFLEAPQRVDGRRPRLGADDSILLGIAPPQVAIDGTEYLRIVVDGEENGAHQERITGGARG
jgi:hypothetical protein